MPENLEKWPSKRGPTSKIRPSDDCGKDAVPLAEVRWSDWLRNDGYLGSIGFKESSGECRLKAAMAVWAAVSLLHAEPVQAKTPVSIELVLAVDTSMSVDGSEFDFLMKGIANAFRTTEIINLIGQQSGVAVTLFQWNSEIDEQFMIPWHVLKDPTSVLSFAAKVEEAERNPYRGFTGIGGAIDFGVRLIAENAFEGRQLKIDVSGDGRNNYGISPTIPRREANALEIVINGLPILTFTGNDSYDLDRYYREKVILGPGAFVEIANDYDDFSRAFLRKLGRELAPVISRNNLAPRRLIQHAHARRLNAR